ncbi:MAG TPA: hypothetical protein VG267_17485 [Terracidiphilus sp.]|jgi:hypothetical protein|nr:hypothetical protein [Terracidiphilus sp.]
MNDGNRPDTAPEDNDVDKAPRGVNLVVAYGVMLFALLVAIGLATLIVLPFYKRR